MEWISVDDQPPSNGYYLIAWHYAGNFFTGEAWYDDTNDWIWPEYGDGKGLLDEASPEVTHWMAMPPPPLMKMEELEP